MPRFTGLMLMVLLTFCSDLARGQSSEPLCSDVQELLFEAQLHNQTAASDLENVVGKVCADENRLNRGSATVAPLIVQPRSGDTPPDGAEAYYNAGMLLQKSGDVHGAIDAYERCISLDDSHLAARQRLADLYFSKGKFAKAISEYRRILDKTPDNHFILVSLGRAYKKTGKLTEAAKSFERATKLAPSDLEPQRELIKLEIKRGNLFIAERMCRGILAQNRDDREERTRLIGILSREKKYNDLVLFLGEEINRYPKESSNYYRLGIVKELLADFRSAIDAFQKAIAINASANAYYAIARSWLSLSDAKSAREALVQAKKIAPDRQDINELLTLIDREHGRSSSSLRSRKQTVSDSAHRVIVPSAVPSQPRRQETSNEHLQ